ncbi:hypothetical protein [Thalassomonas actiniarum]|uniref:Uncharacterized protein n=1 Tax=Thalassomonas actiniarum TaxID=485447 RepID=A0AAE9YNK0_9GAMM|nr:hypothetical protein [Thalassomonas actiniarum]WDD98374.1 hypothetical protein SG35_024400 [Thalassomonas actiniarum]
MSLTQDIANVVQAAENMTATVTGKMGQIDQRMDAAEAEFDVWRNQKDVTGDIAVNGAMRLNIFQGFLHSTGAPYGFGGDSGGFAGKIDDLGSSSNVYLHFKTPMNINTHSEMYWFNIRGYCYGGAKLIDEVIAGYCYATSKSVINKANAGGMSPDSYSDAAGNVILRILVPNTYYNSVCIDTMRVGNGRLFNAGDLDVKVSLADTVDF